MHEVCYHKVYTIVKSFKFARITNCMDSTEDEHPCKFVNDSDDNSNIERTEMKNKVELDQSF